MPRICLKHTDAQVEFADQIALINLDDLIMFGCKSGKCGTCQIRILEGSDNLSSLSEREQKLFQLLGIKDEAIRLACQCIAYGNVLIEEITN